MNRPSNDEIAANIEKAAMAVPVIPESFSESDAPYLPYLKARIEELREIWRSQGMEPEHASILGASELLKYFSSLKELDGITIDYIPNPLSDFLSDGGVDEGTFTVEFSAFHPASSWVKPALGIAYPGAVSPEVFATRWTLQEIDGMESGDAARAAGLL